ncbi:MAG: V-type ATP synthase subunit F [Clostridia bacterium]
MKISWIKRKGDKESFRIFKNLGMEVVELEDMEQADKAIKELVAEKYRTIIVTNEIAGCSEDIIKKYTKSNEVDIIIAPSKKERY